MMTSGIGPRRPRAFATSLLLFAALFTTQAADAALGSYLNGSGTNNRGLSGAGVAFAEDSMVIAINPAGLVALKHDEWQLGSIFLQAYQTGQATPVTPPATPPGYSLPSEKRETDPDVPAEIGDIFPIPFGAITRKLDERNTVGLALYGNGGININYKSFDNPNCPAGTPGKGYLCFGDTNSDIAQMFIAPTWSHKVNDHLRVGISPELIYQTLEINGFQLFAPASSNPNKLSNNGHAHSLGYGVKMGAAVDVNDQLSLGLTLQSRGYMQKLTEYAGLIPEQGDLDVPPYVQFGLAWQPTPKLTLLLDYQRIYFSNIPALANPVDAPGRYGDNNGPGFGWDDMTAIKAGIHYRINERFTLRLGKTDAIREAIGKEDVLANIVSPAVFDEHYNLGLSWATSDTGTLDITLTHAPRQDITGDNPLSPGQKVTFTNFINTIDIGFRRKY